MPSQLRAVVDDRVFESLVEGLIFAMVRPDDAFIDPENTDKTICEYIKANRKLMDGDIFYVLVAFCVKSKQHPEGLSFDGKLFELYHIMHGNNSNFFPHEDWTAEKTTNFLQTYFKRKETLPRIRAIDFKYMMEGIVFRFYTCEYEKPPNLFYSDIEGDNPPNFPRELRGFWRHYSTLFPEHHAILGMWSDYVSVPDDNKRTNCTKMIEGVYNNVQYSYFPVFFSRVIYGGRDEFMQDPVYTFVYRCQKYTDAATKSLQTVYDDNYPLAKLNLATSEMDIPQERIEILMKYIEEVDCPFLLQRYLPLCIRRNAEQVRKLQDEWRKLQANCVTELARQNILQQNNVRRRFEIIGSFDTARVAESLLEIYRKNKTMAQKFRMPDIFLNFQTLTRLAETWTFPKETRRVKHEPPPQIDLSGTTSAALRSSSTGGLPAGGGFQPPIGMGSALERSQIESQRSAIALAAPRHEATQPSPSSSAASSQTYSSQRKRQTSESAARSVGQRETHVTATESQISLESLNAGYEQFSFNADGSARMSFGSLKAKLIENSVDMQAELYGKPKGHPENIFICVIRELDVAQARTLNVFGEPLKKIPNDPHIFYRLGDTSAQRHRIAMLTPYIYGSQPFDAEFLKQKVFLFRSPQGSTVEEPYDAACAHFIGDWVQLKFSPEGKQIARPDDAGDSDLEGDRRDSKKKRKSKKLKQRRDVGKTSELRRQSSISTLLKSFQTLKDNVSQILNGSRQDLDASVRNDLLSKVAHRAAIIVGMPPEAILCLKDTDVSFMIRTQTSISKLWYDKFPYPYTLGGLCRLNNLTELHPIFYKSRRSLDHVKRVIKDVMNEEKIREQYNLSMTKLKSSSATITVYDKTTKRRITMERRKRQLYESFAFMHYYKCFSAMRYIKNRVRREIPAPNFGSGTEIPEITRLCTIRDECKGSELTVLSDAYALFLESYIMTARQKAQHYVNEEKTKLSNKNYPLTDEMNAYRQRILEDMRIDEADQDDDLIQQDEDDEEEEEEEENGERAAGGGRRRAGMGDDSD